MGMKRVEEISKIEKSIYFWTFGKNVLEGKYGIRLSQYGRSGQNQNGIDLYTSGNPRIVIQCKDYLVGKSVADMQAAILEELIKTQKLEFAFAEFWMATSFDRDTQIQNMVERINEVSVKSCAYL